MVKKLLIIAIFFLWITPSFALESSQFVIVGEDLIISQIPLNDECGTFTGLYLWSGSYPATTTNVQSAGCGNPNPTNEVETIIPLFSASYSILSETSVSFDLTASPFSGLSDGTYWLGLTHDSSTKDPYIAWYPIEKTGGVWVGGDFSGTNTRIFEVFPSYMQTQSTSTSFYLEADAYVNTEDFEPDMFMRFRFARQQDLQSAVANQSLLWTTIDFPTLNEGGSGSLTSLYNFISTTTSITSPGVYLWEVEIRRESTTATVLNWLGLGSLFNTGLVVSTSTKFIAGEMTDFDRFVASTTEVVNQVASTTMQQVTESCNPLTFNTALCFEGLFGFQGMGESFENTKNTLFYYVPFGYLTRIVDIFGTTSTSSLPELSYTFPPTSAFLASTTISFNPWQYFYTDGAPVKDQIVDPATGKNIWDIFEPLIKLIVYLSLVLLIVRDLTQLHNNDKEL